MTIRRSLELLNDFQIFPAVNEEKGKLCQNFVIVLYGAINRCTLMHRLHHKYYTCITKGAHNDRQFRK